MVKAKVEFTLEMPDFLTQVLQIWDNVTILKSEL